MELQLLQQQQYGGGYSRRRPGAEESFARTPKELAEFIGVQHLITVNSGSSANLVAFSTLTSSKLGERAIKKGDEVIGVAAGFPTTVNPIVQFGAIPVFVDVELKTHNIDSNLIEAAITKKTAAILVEPVQGEGGIYPAPANYLKSLRKIADEFGILLFFDEVQTGIGRTGKLFAHEWAGIQPDLMSVAKGLGGGFPIGACLATEKAAALTPGSHGSTFGGNPLAASVGNAVLDIVLEDGFLDGVNDKTEKLMDKVNVIAAKHPSVIEEVRGAGLLIGLKCVVPAGDMVNKLFDLGMLTVPAGNNVTRLIPPLIIGDAEIEEAASLIAKACEELR